MLRSFSSLRLLVLFAGVVAARVHAQVGTSTPAHVDSVPSITSSQSPFEHGNDKDPFPVNSSARATFERQRNADRQRRLVADTERLVLLVNSLHDGVAKSNKDILSLNVVKRAEEIEKLAKSVKERMKDQ